MPESVDTGTRISLLTSSAQAISAVLPDQLRTDCADGQAALMNHLGNRFVAAPGMLQDDLRRDLLQLELADYVHWLNNFRLRGTLGSPLGLNTMRRREISQLQHSSARFR
jgi:hypothetical protein